MAFGPNPPPIQVHLCVKGGDAAIAFYEKAFGGNCTFKQMAEDGRRVMHANVAVFGDEVMLHDEVSEHDGDVAAPASGGARISRSTSTCRSPPMSMRP
jgi:PhnB protein